MSILLFSFLLTTFAASPETGNSCQVEVIDDETFKIKSGDGQELIVLGHVHRTNVSIGAYSRAVANAAKSTGENEKRKWLKAIREFDFGVGEDVNVPNFYKKYAQPTDEKLNKLLKSEQIDFFGLELPYAMMEPIRLETQKSIETYTKLAREAYGSQYYKTQLKEDLLGMYGPNFYYAANRPAGPSAEGVESHTFVFSEVKNINSFYTAVSDINKFKNRQNEAAIKEIIELIEGPVFPGIGEPLKYEQALQQARTLSPADLYQKVQALVEIRKKLDKDNEQREDWALKTMKMRSNKKGLLMIGKSHLDSLKKKAHLFCNAKKHSHISEKAEVGPK
jgi:hypothetical protein